MYEPPVPANTYRCTVFYRDPGSGLAWSEVYWPTGQNSIDTAQARFIPLVNARTAMNEGSIQFIAARVSDEQIQRDAYLMDRSSGDGLNVNNAADTDNVDAEMPYSTVLVRQQATSRYWAQRYISGIQSNFVTDPPGPATNTAFGGAFQAFRSEMLGTTKTKIVKPAFGMLVISREPGDVQATNIQTFTAVVPGGTIYTITVQNNTFAVGDVVKVTGAKWNGVKGNLRYLVLTSNAATGVLTVQSEVAGLVYSSGGKIGKVIRKLVPLTDVRLRGETHRKRGGRFFLPRGRASKRA